MVLVFTATLLAYVHHVTCQEHKVRGDGLRTGREEEGETEIETVCKKEKQKIFSEGKVEKSNSQS
jgi:hypothetical protein